ncbi:RES family NAD+ phosphorylase [Niabella hirudinis]|uniref:RES family NAD+ phosphorylase n=1 Tax=Niabella hirudinis TaxID=1285929 RepID=UPI003EBB827B
MLVYNIRRAKYAGSLTASGVANRWNMEEEFVIYTGCSRALSVLEIVVHRSGIVLNEPYRLLVIEIKETPADILELKPDQLPEKWRSLVAYPKLQGLGSDWYQGNKQLLLKVPSAVVPMEYNILINTRHPKFNTHVRLKDTEIFDWDERLF